MGTAWGHLEEAEKSPSPPPTLGRCARAVLARARGLPYVFLAVVGALAFGGAILVLPLVFGFAMWSLLFGRVGLGERAADPLPLVTLFGLGAAPYVSAELVDAALRHANLVAPGAPLLAAAIAGWVALPLLSMPAHLAFHQDEALVALGRALAAADERRARFGAIPMALAGLALGALLVTPRWLLDVDFNAFTSLAALLGHRAMGYSYWAVALAALPVMLIVPALSATLAEHDDALLSQPKGGAARSPLRMAAPLFVAVGLVLVAFAHLPARPSESYTGALDEHQRVPSSPPGVTIGIPDRPPAAWEWELVGAPAFSVQTSEGTEPIAGPYGARTAGIVAAFSGETGLVFGDAHQGYVVTWLDRDGHRLDDSIFHRVASRLDGASLALFAALFFGALLLHRLRPGDLHRLTKPGRFAVRGTLELDDDTVPQRRGSRVVLRGRGHVGTFRADDGGLIVALTEATMLFGLPPFVDSGMKVMLVAPMRPPSLALREGTAPLPDASAIVGDAEPVDTVLSTAMHRSAAIPLLLLSALASVLCVRLVMALG